MQPRLITAYQENGMPQDRRSHRSRLLVTAGALAVLLVVSAPIVASRAFAQAGPDVLRIAQIEQVTNFDPALMSTQDMGVLIDNVYEGLIGTEKDTVRIVPRLAEKWALSPDGKSMTFVLRKNVKFHDGTPFDAEAVRFSIERVKTI